MSRDTLARIRGLVVVFPEYLADEQAYEISADVREAVAH